MVHKSYDLDQEKFNIVLETASLNEEELSAYCRPGLYPEQIEKWRRRCTKANEPVAHTRADREKARQQERHKFSSLKSNCGARKKHTG